MQPNKSELRNMQTNIQFTNGAAAARAGYPRTANPVAYIGANGQLSAAQAALRDLWFDGWDSVSTECYPDPAGMVCDV